MRRCGSTSVDAVKLMKMDKAKYSKLIKEKYFPDMGQGIWDDTYEEPIPAFVDDGRVTNAGWRKWCSSFP